jgi:hypothetical protein
LVKFIKQSSDGSDGTKGRSLQAVQPGRSLGATRPRGAAPFKKSGAKGLPNATIIYGVGASALVVISIYTTFVLANWFTGLLLFVLGCALLGYALYFLRYQ